MSSWPSEAEMLAWSVAHSVMSENQELVILSSWLGGTLVFALATTRRMALKYSKLIASSS